MAGLVQRFADGLVSFGTRLGTGQDKISTASYAYSQLEDQQLEAAYSTSWVAEQLVDLPSFDATRKWREWSGDGAKELEAAERELGLQSRTQSAHAQSRLLGGGCILIGIPSDQNWMEPINVDRIRRGSVEYLVEFSRSEIMAGEIEQDPRQPEFRYPKWYEIATGNGINLRVHPSRLAKFRGKRNAGRGGYNNAWGRSVLQTTYDACRNFDSTMANVASLVFDAKTDVIHIPGLMERLTQPGFEDELLKRFSVARMMMGNHGTLILDGGGREGEGGEEYQSKSYSFGGLDSIMDRFMTVVAGAADIPMVRMFGVSAAGMNSTGEIDLANYHESIAATQTIQIGPSLSILDECLIRSTLGRRPDDLKYEWRPLRQMTEAQISEIRNRDADTISKLAATQEFAPEEIRGIARKLQRDSGIDVIEDAAPPGAGGDDDDPDGLGIGGLSGQDRPIGDAAPRALYVRRDVLNADEIIEWARGQGFTSTLPADDMHVTITFSRQPVDWMKMGESHEDQIEVGPGGPRVMEAFGANGEAKVLAFAASRLSWRHESMVEQGASWDHPQYQPHITISYDPAAPDVADIEPYRGRIVLGPEIFEEVEEDWASNIKET